MASDNRLVIVGGGLATARATKAYREAGGDGSIAVFSRDRVVPYHRPPLSKRYLRGETEWTDALVEPENFYRDHDVELFLETDVTALLTDERKLVLGDGGSRSYDRLLIASGAWPRRLEVEGADLPGVFTLRTLDNSTAIREAAKNAREAVVVGAGFIGMEVAASLATLGVEVTMVHRGKGLFEILRARQCELFFVELYARNGVELVLADDVDHFGGRSQLDSVVTKRGRTIQAELAVVGIGVDPVTGWLEGSGLELDNGVVVNERYETSAPNVWAVGDVANFYDPVFDTRRRIEHWSNANHQGSDVGKVLAGAGGGYDVVSTFFSEVFGVTIKVFGDIDRFDEVVFRGALEDGNAIAFYLQEDRFVACLVTGQDEKTEDRLKELLREQPKVEDLQALSDPDVSLDEAFGPLAASR
jgi:3-phenylpropionate/trans-cinnamate dioxygenase ferredoxin reductase component